MPSFAAARERMIGAHLVARGVRDKSVLAAMGTVPREEFLPPHLAEFAYEDTPLPIGSGQTISQPYIVALMAEALRLQPSDRVLEIGTGSGYAAAILGQVAREVYSVERHAPLVEEAQERIARLGLRNIHLLHGDGTLGWPEFAPYDAIVVAAGGPEVPSALVAQLAPGGRLVIPIGADRELQTLVRITRQRDGRLTREELGGVRFVPLIGTQGWPDAPHGTGARSHREPVVTLLREVAEPVTGEIDTLPFDATLDRIGDARVVCLGEATHGTAEFYAMRARLTRRLIETKGFTLVTAEADWPDAARVDAYVRHRRPAPPDWRAFGRFPEWMWRNQETLAFVEWMREWNADHAPVGFFGLDLYSLYRSLHLVLDYLDRIDPPTARVARERYGGLMPWAADPATYGKAVLTGRYRSCEAEVTAMLRHLLARELAYASRDGEYFLDAAGNARVVASAEAYYRVMYYGGAASWNQRDRHMMATLEAVMRHHGPRAKAVVWAHNSHLGDASATEMGARGELNVGQLCRQSFGDRAYLIGFGTDHGTVAAAHDWGGPMEVMSVRPAHPQSYEILAHESGVQAFCLPLRHPARPAVREELMEARLERAIGVIYRPDTELQSHYFQAVLPVQFDEWIWVDETHAVHPVREADLIGMSHPHPFASIG